MMYPTDNTFFTKLKDVRRLRTSRGHRPRTARRAGARSASKKANPSSPTDKQKELLKKAVETAPKMILATRQLGRPDGRNKYYKDRQYDQHLGRAAPPNGCRTPISM
ncbi:MAG: hypothetical protein QM706_18060 [Nitrospira sp.]